MKVIRGTKITKKGSIELAESVKRRCVNSKTTVKFRFSYSSTTEMLQCSIAQQITREMGGTGELELKINTNNKNRTTQPNNIKHTQ